MKKPVIEYPCTWSYRAIGSDEGTMMREISVKLGTIKHEITMGNQSKNGTYISINIDALVASETERLSIIPLLQSIKGVKMVL
jgi:putative lipoic acid-binding regulatory protein